MDFGTILKNECVNVPLPPDERCTDPAFAFANPTTCPVVPKLILKPGSALVCLLGSIQFRAFYVSNGTETDVTDSTLFSVDDQSVCVIGASSGNATGIQGGEVTVTASYQNLTAAADLTVIADDACCEQESVAFMVMVDTSLSMSQAFGGQSTTKLDFAKKSALQFISEVDALKDKVGLMTFNGFDFDIIDEPTADKSAVQSHVSSITQTQQSTSFFTAMQAAVASLNSSGAERLVIVIVSDGQDESAGVYATQNPVSVAQTFKQAIGSIICLGVRASGTGYSLLNAICTGGFFINSYVGIENSALSFFSGLKGYVCGGNCVPKGDVTVATGTLNYTHWINWIGLADLLGNGFVDLLPGNGLYVDLSSASSPFAATLVSKNSFAVVAGKDYRLTMLLAGNQRVDLPSNVTVKIASASFTYLNQTLSITDYTAGFSQHAFTFTPQTGDDVTITISGSGSDQLAVAGPLLDSISFDNVTDLVNLFSDDFSSENLQYVPPQCGTGTTPIYTGVPGGAFDFIDSTNAADFTIALTDPIDTDTIKAKLIKISLSCFTGDSSVADNLGNVYTALTKQTAAGQFVQLFYCINPITGVNHTFTGIGDFPHICVEAFSCTGEVSFVGESGAADFQPGVLNPVGMDLFITGMTTTGGVNGIDSGFTIASSVAGGGPTCAEAYKISNTPENPTWDDGAGAGTIASAMALFTTMAGYGFATGYSCYATGCLNSEPPPAQLQDPKPLPDIEAGFTPPQQFKSTKTVCVTCPTGFANVLVPDVSSSSGLADPSDPDFTKTITFQFNTAQTAIGYAVTGNHFVNAAQGNIFPCVITLQGSSDSTNWTTIDVESTSLTFSTILRRAFILNPEVIFSYYRVIITSERATNNSSAYWDGAGFALYGLQSKQVCDTESEISSISQADADTQATASATDGANSKLQCIQIFSSTQSYTAHCPAGSLGNSATQSASANSFISQADADANALAAAQELAVAALVCSGDNHNQAVTIRDNATAVPYPSVKLVSGLTGHITKVTVTVKNFSHAAPADVQMVLQSPTGTYVQLMLRCGGPIGANPVTNLTFQFDDSGVFMPQNSALSSGIFKPTQFGSVPDLAPPAAAHPYQTALATLIGEVPNGSWALWIMDILAVSAGSIAGVPSFDVTITST